MEAIAAVGAIWSLYQLAQFVSAECFWYSEGVKRSGTAASGLLDQMQSFQNSLIRYRAILEDENQDSKVNRLPALANALKEDSPSFRNCLRELEYAEKKLKRARDEQKGVKGLVRKLTWPMREEEFNRIIDNVRVLSERLDQAQNTDQMFVMSSPVIFTTQTHQPTDKSNATSTPTSID